MRILVVTPWAPSITRPRSLGLIKFLAQRHEVAVVGAAWSETEVTELRMLPVSRVFPVRLGRFGAYLRCFRGLLKGRSLQQSYVDAPELRAKIREALKDFQPDACYFNVIRSAQLADEVAETPKIIDLDEFRSNYYQILSTSSRNPLWRLIAKYESRRMRQAEEVVLETFESVLVSSPTDLVAESDKIRLVRSPHALEAPVVTGHENGVGRPNRSGIVFAGRQSYRANAEGVAWFAREVMPRVIESIPNAHLSIVGDAPPRKTRQLAGPHVTVTGRVDDIAAYYSSAGISIVPIQMATGVQMKLIESMALRTPVVVTRIVAEGAGIDETHCVIAETADEWATVIVAMLKDPSLGESLAHNAASWALDAYSPESISDSLHGAISDLAGSSELRQPL